MQAAAPPGVGLHPWFAPREFECQDSMAAPVGSWMYGSDMWQEQLFHVALATAATTWLWWRPGAMQPQDAGVPLLTAAVAELAAIVNGAGAIGAAVGGAGVGAGVGVGGKSLSPLCSAVEGAAPEPVVSAATAIGSWDVPFVLSGMRVQLACRRAAGGRRAAAPMAGAEAPAGWGSTTTSTTPGHAPGDVAASTDTAFVGTATGTATAETSVVTSAGAGNKAGGETYTAWREVFRFTPRCLYRAAGDPAWCTHAPSGARNGTLSPGFKIGSGFGFVPVAGGELVVPAAPVSSAGFWIVKHPGSAHAAHGSARHGDV